MPQAAAPPWSAVSIATSVQAGQLAVAEVAEFYCQRTEALADRLKTHLFFSRAQVATEVERVEQLISQTKKAAAPQLPLAGVPILVKDNIATHDMPMTCGSRLLAGFRPHYDASAVARLRSAGALIFGKLNLDEFAMGSSGENSAYGTVLNPLDESRVAGGSSGGSAAAVAAHLAPIALGTDTGGSIRQPASFCGISGFKPTYGRVSRYGLTALASSLEQIGPMAQSVADLCLVQDVMAGPDRADATSWPGPYTKGQPLLARWSEWLAGLRIGLITEHRDGLKGAAAAQAVEAAAAVFEAAGAKVEPVSLPSLELATAAYYILASAEASSNLARFDGVRYGQRAAGETPSLATMYQRTRGEKLGPEVIQRILMGSFILASPYSGRYYEKAQAARQCIAADLAAALTRYRFLIGPSTPSGAFRLGEKAADPLAMYLSDIFTTPANLAGLPAISIPCGADAAGMPLGLQIMAKAHADADLLLVAHAFQELSDWHRHAWGGLPRHGIA